jgi:galactokinase
MNSYVLPFSKVYNESQERYASILTRIKKIQQEFMKLYGKKPTFFGRAPGRVNLIGEHIDYCGYSVVPMAIEQDIGNHDLIDAVIAVHVGELSNEPCIRIANTDSDKYPSRQFRHDRGNICEIDATVHEWSNYFKCGYVGMHETMKGSDREFPELLCLVDGAVPSVIELH